MVICFQRRMFKYRALHNISGAVDWNMALRIKLLLADFVRVGCTTGCESIEPTCMNDGHCTFKWMSTDPSAVLATCDCTRTSYYGDHCEKGKRFCPILHYRHYFVGISCVLFKSIIVLSMRLYSAQKSSSRSSLIMPCWKQLISNSILRLWNHIIKCI